MTMRPDLAVESELLIHGQVGGLDEVGRGALAGPVTVGLVVLDRACGAIPAGLADSKLLRPAQRTALVPVIEAWAAYAAVVHRTASYIDEWGIMAALSSAAQEALDRVTQVGARPYSVIVDGPHNYVGAHPSVCAFIPRVKADLHCASVAAASVLAKVERDRLMVELGSQCPAYGWSANKGYGAPAHRAAIAEHGVTEWHRRSWNLSTKADIRPQDAQGDFFSTN